MEIKQRASIPSRFRLLMECDLRRTKIIATKGTEPFQNSPPNSLVVLTEGQLECQVQEARSMKTSSHLEEEWRLSLV